MTRRCRRVENISKEIEKYLVKERKPQFLKTV